MTSKNFLFILLLSFSVILLSLIINHQPSIINHPISSLQSPTSFPRSLFTINYQSLSIIAVGDIMLGRECNVRMSQLKDYRYPFLKTADFTKNADLTFGNLETPITSDCRLTSVGMVFCAQKETLEGLKYAGFDLVSLTNNHASNQGTNGLAETKTLLNQQNIGYFDGDGKVLTVKSTKIGFVGYNLLDKYDQNQIVTKIKELKKTSDLVVLSLHWGNEYQKNPSNWQKELAHTLIDFGADLIIGHHPHVSQPVEEYNGKLIFYSLGNFVFDQPWSEETKKGQIAVLEIKDKKVSYYLKDIYMKSLCQPELSSK